jgi:hypothetical protein
MTDKETGYAPADPSVEDDRLGRREDAEVGAKDEGVRPDDEEARSEGEAEDAEPERERRPRGARRQLTRATWLLVAVVAVVGALAVVELVRIATSLNTSACIQRAQADFQEALGPGVSPQFAGLDRLSGQNQLKKCGP